MNIQHVLLQESACTEESVITGIARILLCTLIPNQVNLELVGAVEIFTTEVAQHDKSPEVKTWRLTEIIWQQNKSVGKPGASPELLSVPLQVICRSGHVLKTAVWGTLGQ